MIFNGSIIHTIRADIEIQAKGSEYPIGIFGHYKSLTVSFENEIQGKQVFAQDLATDECVEITNRVEFIDGNKIKIDGAIIDEIGLSVCECATELPGLVVVIK